MSDAAQEEVRTLIRWHLTQEERQKIVSGQDVYLFYFPAIDRYSLEIAPEGTSHILSV